MTIPNDLLDPEVQQGLDIIRPVPPRDSENRMRARARFLSEARELQSTKNPTVWQRLLGIFGRSVEQKMSPAIPWKLSTLTLVLTIGLVLLFSGSVATAYAAQSALPGDPLFGLKNVTEDARVRLNPDPGADADLHLLFAQRRIEEIRDLIATGRFGDISIATREFERHILQAIGALGQLAATDPDRAAVVTDRILAALANYTAALTAYLGNVPAGTPQQALEMAVQTSQARFRPSEFEFSGVISAMQVNQWIVADKTVGITPQTNIKGIFNVGDLAEVEALVAANGSLTAQEIKSAEDEVEETTELKFSGVVEQLDADRWVVGGRGIILTAQTEIKDAIQPGDLVQIEAMLQDNGVIIAIEIKLLQSQQEINANENDDDGPSENVNANDNGSEDSRDDDRYEAEDESEDDANESESHDNDSDNEDDHHEEEEDEDANDNESNHNEEPEDEEAPED
jgi:hypothetical protein